MSRVVLQNVDKTYPNGVAAVCGLNLDIAAGEFFVLLGPSGCGKTTTLRLIAGLEQADRGQIVIGDRQVNALPPFERDVAMVLQNAALYPHMSAFENMAFSLRSSRVTQHEIERRVNEAASALSIHSLLGRTPAQLSGGEQRRVAIGRAIVRAPQVFLFDEPLSDLDPPLRGQLRAQLKRLHAQLRTAMIYVTHDQAEAMALADRIAIMEQGQVRQIGNPLDVYRRPATAFVASFMGNPGMNLLKGEKRGGNFYLDDAGGSAENGQPWGGDLFAGTRIDDGAVILGIRPEDLLPAARGASLVSVHVDVVERLCHETLAHCSVGSQKLVARLPIDFDASPGDDVRLSVQPGANHFFSAADGRRLH